MAQHLIISGVCAIWGLSIGISSPFFGVMSSAYGIETKQLFPPPSTLKRLTLLEISQRMKEISGWRTDGKKIYCMRQFKDFPEAVKFVSRLVEPSEKAAHHPDIQISYNQVTISLTTHDVRGLTDQDFTLAKAISQVAASFASGGTGC